MNKDPFRCFVAVAGAATLFGFSVPVSAAPPPAKSTVEFTKPPSKFSFSAGVAVRRINAEFGLSGNSSANDLLRVAGPFRGFDAFIRDARFRPIGPFEPFSVAAVGEFVSVEDTFFEGNVPGLGYASVSHAQFFGVERSGVRVSDSDVGVGPYLQLTCHLIDRDNRILNGVLGWSFVSTEHGSGTQPLMALTRTDIAFAVTLPEPGTPFTDFDSLFQLLIHQSDKVIATAVGSADLDVALNEIPLGLEFGRRIGRLEVLGAMGVTLNVISHDLDSRLVWSRVDGSTITQRWHDEGSDVRMGLYGGLTLRCPLTEDGRVFLEAHGSYRWVHETRAHAGFASVEIDPSSWEGGVGLRINL